MIKINMDMPNNCYDCPLKDSEFEYCCVAYGIKDFPLTIDENVSKYITERTKPDWCPLEECEEIDLECR